MIIFLSSPSEIPRHVSTQTFIQKQNSKDKVLTMTVFWMLNIRKYWFMELKPKGSKSLPKHINWLFGRS